MPHILSNSNFHLFRCCLVVGIFVLVSHVGFAQEEEVFRDIGWDLNVDPMSYPTDAVGMIDINNDGWIDLYPGYRFCLNTGVVDGSLQPFTFADSAKIAGESRFADFNNDGHVDAYATLQAYPQDYLWRNEGDEIFVDVAESMGIHYTATKFSLACGWADYNNDGWVDLLVAMNIGAGAGSGIYLWKNEGGEHFVNVADQMQVNVPNPWHGMVWADIDNDNDSDFFAAGGRKGDGLFRNDGNKFVNITNIAKTSGVGVVGHSRSGAWGDFNNDGRLDLFVCDDEKANRLFRNDGNGVWPDVAAELHVDNFDPTGWNVLHASATAVWGDYDNDGDIDLFVTSQEGQYNAKSENKLFRNDGAAGFTEVGHTMEITNQGQYNYAAAFGDIDNDGDLDLYIGVKESLLPLGLGGGMDLLFENLIGTDNNWLEFRLTGVHSNRSAIGARIRCVTDTLSQIREVQGGNGYNSMNPFVQHFGFAQRTLVDSVIIRWPSGQVDRLTNVPVNQILDITESTIGVESKITMPAKLSLEGSYPNPFNSQTIIRFTLPNLSRVSLTVVDITGRQVRVLVDDRLLSGIQEIRWDGRDEFKRSVSSGMYLCRLIVDDTVLTHSMLFLK